MNAADKMRFAIAMNALAEVKRLDLTPTIFDAYFEDLAAFPLDVVQEALKRCRRDLVYFPQPVEIIERARAIRAERATHHKALPPAPATPEEEDEVVRARMKFRELIEKLTIKIGGT